MDEGRCNNSCNDSRTSVFIRSSRLKGFSSNKTGVQTCCSMKNIVVSTLYTSHYVYARLQVTIHK